MSEIIAFILGAGIAFYILMQGMRHFLYGRQAQDKKNYKVMFDAGYNTALTIIDNGDKAGLAVSKSIQIAIDSLDNHNIDTEIKNMMQEINDKNL